ncbi:MAG: proteasome accessory factor PafA2 [Candidatus Nanopelagicales bacterium]|nr:proteasome accessory factor PafA2 [Candidatus Nanopelagicales bacterium]MCF8538926.1 proteasome accessory factor PafA2 [Candidatus Nanopelagicales bacterium]MCF8550692.1 proteasome accessory factor PafA2 [Candidatus Nanopelagicales bacterium]
MSVRRVMGIETEFGISVPGHPTMNAMVTSSHIVNSYARLVGLERQASTHWDYEQESPLRDARGFDVSRADAHPSQLTDVDDSELGLANLILTNGARFYVDHAHPEYSSPEVTNPRDAVLWDRAGARIAQQAANAGPLFDGVRIHLYKNNVDNKGASYGCHENYLMRRTTPFADIVKTLTPFFVTRQIFTGAGRLGKGQDGKTKEFQISQRADYFEVEVGLETTLKRPIINTRDEPHADPEKYRRLHVIVGDANLSDTATLLKMGTTSLVLSLIESGFDISGQISLSNAVKEMTQVSYDLSLTHELQLNNGSRMTAIDIQRIYLEASVQYCQVNHVEDPDTQEILSLWRETLDALATDPMSLSGTIDWIAKLGIMRGYIRRDNLEWSDPRLALVDLQYSDVDRGKGIAAKLEDSGKLTRLFSDEQVESATRYPPPDTRAYFRGECIRRYPDNIAAASWDSVVFDTGGDTLLRVPTLEPLRGSRDAISGILEASSTASELVNSLRESE